MVFARVVTLVAAFGIVCSAQAPASAPAAASGPFKLVPLPYAYDALEPVIDNRTMRLHHDAHTLAYVTNLNNALATPAGNGLSSLSLAKMLAAVSTSALPPSIATAVRNNAGGNANHIFFFKGMTSPSNATGSPVGTLGAAINSTFGNFSSFQTQFNKQGAERFGSGFVWLVYQPNGTLVITNTANQDNPLMTNLPGNVRGIPIITNDVWEHAYYLKYQNRRPAYLTEWWKVVDWNQAEANYVAAKNGTNMFEASS